MLHHFCAQIIYIFNIIGACMAYTLIVYVIASKKSLENSK